MWYIECHNCGNKIWEGQKAVLADVNEGVGRFPFCSDQCLFEYLDALRSHVWKNCDDEYVWKEDKRRKRLPNESNTDARRG